MNITDSRKFSGKVCNDRFLFLELLQNYCVESVAWEQEKCLLSLEQQNQ